MTSNLNRQIGETDRNLSELEKRVRFAEKCGQVWASIHEIWLQLDKDEKPYLAALMNDLQGDMSEAARERLAKGSKEFREYITNMCIAKGEELRARIKYENAQAWFEAGRSLESTERAKMKMF